MTDRRRVKIRCALLCTAVCAAMLTPYPVRAQEGYRLTGVRFSGVHAFSHKALRERMVLRARTGLQRILFWVKAPPFSSSILERDLERLERFYQSEGFLHVRLNHSLERDDEEGTVELAIAISEGEAVHVREIIDNLVLQPGQNETVIRGILAEAKPSLRPGMRFRDPLARAHRNELLTTLAGAGFPFARVDLELELDDAESLVDIDLRIVPMYQRRFGEVTVLGDSRTPAAKITRQLTFQPGKIYSPKALEESQRRIYQLALFQYVTVRVVMDEENIVQPVEVVAVDAPRLTSKIGAGYGREDRFRGSIELRRLGFLGGTRRMRVFARHSGLEPYHFNFRITQPGIPRPETQINLNPFIKKEKEPGYTVRRGGSHLSLQHHFATYSDAIADYTFERVKLESGPSAREMDIAAYNKSSLTLGVMRDNSEPSFSPVRGSFRALTVTFAGLLVPADFHYLRILTEWRHYLSLDEGWILATRAKLGAMAAQKGDPFTPIEERFFAGGSASVRGWARSQLGPGSAAGVPTGGDAYFEGSTELRHPLWSALSGCLFADFGNVWRQRREARIDDLHFAAGIGLRYRTPIGPIRLDLAMPVFEPSRTLQVHVSVGQAF